MTKAILVAWLLYGCSGGDEFTSVSGPPEGAGSMSVTDSSKVATGGQADASATGGGLVSATGGESQSTGGAQAVSAQAAAGSLPTGGASSTGGTSSSTGGTIGTGGSSACAPGTIGCQCLAYELCYDPSTATCFASTCLGAQGHACASNADCLPTLSCKAKVCTEQPAGTGGATSVVVSTGGNSNAGKHDAGGSCKVNSDCVSWLICLQAGSCG